MVRLQVTLEEGVPCERDYVGPTHSDMYARDFGERKLYENSECVAESLAGGFGCAVDG